MNTMDTGPHTAMRTDLKNKGVHLEFLVSKDRSLLKRTRARAGSGDSVGLNIVLCTRRSQVRSVGVCKRGD